MCYYLFDRTKVTLPIGHCVHQRDRIPVFKLTELIYSTAHPVIGRYTNMVKRGRREIVCYQGQLLMRLPLTFAREMLVLGQAPVLLSGITL